MKLFIRFAIFFAFYFSYTQNNVIEKNKLYYFNQTMESNESKSFLNDKESLPNFNFKRRHKVKVIYVDKDSVEFRYLTFKDLNDQKIYNNNTFTISKSDFEKLTKTYYGRFKKWKVGTYTIPFRIRSKNDTFEFDSNLSLGTNLIKGINFDKYSNSFHIDFSLGIALTKINLTEGNSNIKAISDDLKKLSESALTISFGATINFSEKVNLGLFYGWDFLDGQAQTQTKWIHNKKPWIGFGINISFKNNGESSSTQEQQT